MTESRTPEMRHAADVLHWSQELLSSQQTVLEKGSFPGQLPLPRLILPPCCADRAEFGPMTVTQIAHITKALLPIIHLSQSLPQDAIQIGPYIETFHSAIQILRELRPRFDVVVRHLDAVEEHARQLGVALPPSSAQRGGPTNTDTQDRASGPSDVDYRPAESGPATVPSEADTRQGLQTSGSGAIQALLSLSGRAKHDPSSSAGNMDALPTEHGGSAEGLDAWWASVLSGTLEGTSGGTGF